MHFYQIYFGYKSTLIIFYNICIIVIICSCLNPVIYGFLHQQVRRTFVDMVKCNNTDDRLRAEQQKVIQHPGLKFFSNKSCNSNEIDHKVMICFSVDILSIFKSL